MELTSMGTFIAEDGDTEIVFKNKDKYKKLVIRNNIIIGCILLGYPELSSKISGCINNATALDHKEIKLIQDNDWSQFK